MHDIDCIFSRQLFLMYPLVFILVFSCKIFTDKLVTSDFYFYMWEWHVIFQEQSLEWKIVIIVNDTKGRACLFSMPCTYSMSVINLIHSSEGGYAWTVNNLTRRESERMFRVFYCDNLVEVVCEVVHRRDKKRDF